MFVNFCPRFVERKPSQAAVTYSNKGRSVGDDKPVRTTSTQDGTRSRPAIEQADLHPKTTNDQMPARRRHERRAMGPSGGMADALDLKSSGGQPPCGFDSRLGYLFSRHFLPIFAHEQVNAYLLYARFYA